MNTRTFLHQVTGLLLVTSLLCGAANARAATPAPEATQKKVRAKATPTNCVIGDTVNLTATLTGVTSPRIQWSIASKDGVVGAGMAQATFTGATKTNASVTFSQPGTYIVKVVAKKGSWTGQHTAQVKVKKPAPKPTLGVVIRSTSDMTGHPTKAGENVLFFADLTGDFGNAKGKWEVVGNPKAFVPLGRQFTGIALAGYFRAAGEYTLRFTVTAGALTASDDYEVRVTN